MPVSRQIISKMENLAQEWEEALDKRAIFLRCYCMMTGNMLTAIEQSRFHDNEWVGKLLHRFADYYFDALACFDCGEPVPLVWKAVHNASSQANLHTLQHLLLGVNAHINFDLVLTLYELLEPEWKNLSPDDQLHRYQDHYLVNQIIKETIDQVQDEIVEQYSPSMDLVDKAMGRLDEWLLGNLITRWREGVWENTQQMMNCSNEEQKKAFVAQLEKDVLQRANWLELKLWNN